MKNSTKSHPEHSRFLFTVIVIQTLLAACTPQPTGPQTLTVMVHDSFSVSEKIVSGFNQANNANLVLLKSGDAGVMLSKAILSKQAPLADVLYGVDNTFLSRALEAGIFESYASPALEDVPDEFGLDESHGAVPIDFGDVCINYDKAYFLEHGLKVPDSLEALVEPEYKGLLVVENPNTSSPGLAFMLATRAHFGEGWLTFWQSLRENEVVIANDWESAYYTNFSGSSGHGLQPMVVSYATSPAAEFIFADPPVDESPTASILGQDTCFRQIEFAGILKGTQQRALAEKFLDYMLSVDFQEDMPMQMFVFPVNPEAKLPEAFLKYAEQATDPARIPAEEIAANRDQWLDDWSEVMLR